MQDELCLFFIISSLLLFLSAKSPAFSFPSHSPVLLIALDLKKFYELELHWVEPRVSWLFFIAFCDLLIIYSM
jgi:hypothetical protein